MKPEPTRKPCPKCGGGLPFRGEEDLAYGAEKGLTYGIKRHYCADTMEEFDSAAALRSVNSRIAVFEREYGFSSDEMRRRVLGGELAETADVCVWLMLMNRQSRLASGSSDAR